MDALFYSRRPEDHAELARSIAELGSGGVRFVGEGNRGASDSAGQAEQIQAERSATRQLLPRRASWFTPGSGGAQPLRGSRPSQAEFFQAANAAAVQGGRRRDRDAGRAVAAGGRVEERAEPRGGGDLPRAGCDARREPATFAAGARCVPVRRALDANHQRAIVSLITGRARQALPGVAKRVMNEWTSTIVAANQDRRARQHAAERRVDIAGSSGGAGEGRRSMAPRDIDYARMSDGDILNL